MRRLLQLRLLLLVLGVDLKLLQLLSRQKGLYRGALVTLWAATIRRQTKVSHFPDVGINLSCGNLQLLNLVS
jgi:hypothetical protein